MQNSDFNFIEIPLLHGHSSVNISKIGKIGKIGKI